VTPRPKLDPVGAVLSIVGLVTLLWAIIEAPGKGWSSTGVLVSLGVGLVSLVAFALWEAHSDHPMLDVNFFRKARFSAASIAVTLVFFAMLGSLFMLTQYLQFVLGYSALEAGIRIMPFALTMMVVAPLSARIVERVGTKITVTGGLLTIATGLALFATLQVDTAYPQLAFALVVMASGMGLVMAPATESIMGSLPPGKAGVGSAVNDTTRQMGGALGVAVLGSAFASVYSSKITEALTGAGLPADAVTGAQESMGGALHAAAQIGGPAGEQIVMLARQAFVDALHPAVLVGAAVAIVGAVITAIFLPARAVDPVEAVLEGDVASVNALTTPETPASSAAVARHVVLDGDVILPSIAAPTPVQA
jgi:Na+/melibiose symporter-like transporter